MSEMIIGDVKMTIDGVPVDVSSVSLRADRPRRAPIGSFEGNFEMQIDAVDAQALIDSLRPRGYWLRRQLYQRRRFWRIVAGQLGIAYNEARELCRSGEVEITP